MPAPENDGDEVEALLAGVRAARPRALARAISAIENSSPILRPIVAGLARDTGRARVIGLTGAPGVGKSTVVAALVGALRERGERVGVLAVDPSSPFSGGAVLGDRIRMQAHALDERVYIRSMATRGRLGGVSAAVPQVLRVFDAGGFDTVLLETVGVGQTEVEVAALADLTMVLVAPGMGDGIQAAKAGILEVGDLFVVNKADRDGASAVVRDLRGMVALAQGAPRWQPRVVATVAVRGEGISDLVAAIDAFVAQATESGAFQARRLERARREVDGLAVGILRARLAVDVRLSAGALAEQVRDGKLDPYTAAERLVGVAEAPLTRGEVQRTVDSSAGSESEVRP